MMNVLQITVHVTVAVQYKHRFTDGRDVERRERFLFLQLYVPLKR